MTIFVMMAMKTMTARNDDDHKTYHNNSNNKNDGES